MDGADAIFAPKLRGKSPCGETAGSREKGKPLADSRHEFQGGTGDGVRRIAHAFFLAAWGNGVASPSLSKNQSASNRLII